MIQNSLHLQSINQLNTTREIRRHKLELTSTNYNTPHLIDNTIYPKHQDTPSDSSTNITMHRECPFLDFDTEYESDTNDQFPMVKGSMARKYVPSPHPITPPHPSISISIHHHLHLPLSSPTRLHPNKSPRNRPQTLTSTSTSTSTSTHPSNPSTYARTHTRKPTDVTPSSILEFRARCLPSREKPSRALVVRPSNPTAYPRHILPIVAVDIQLDSPISLILGSSAERSRDAEMLRGLFRSMSLSEQKKDNASRQPSIEEERKKKSATERETQLIRLHEPIKAVFDLSKPERCPVVKGMLVVDMYTVLLRAMMSENGHGSATDEVHSAMASAVARRGHA